MAYPRYIEAYNPSPRIVRAGGADAYTPTTPHRPSPTATRKKAINNNPLSARCSSVSCCAGISVQFNSNHACLLSPFALSMYPTITTQRLCCSGTLPGLFLVCTGTYYPLNDWFVRRFQARNRGKTNWQNFIMNVIEQPHAKRTNEIGKKEVYPETTIIIECLDILTINELM